MKAARENTASSFCCKSCSNTPFSQTTLIKQSLRSLHCAGSLVVNIQLCLACRCLGYVLPATGGMIDVVVGFSGERSHTGREVRENDWARHVQYCKAHGPTPLQTFLTDPVLNSESPSHFPLQPWALDNLTLSTACMLPLKCSSFWVELGGQMNFCSLPQILLKHDLTSAALLKHFPVQEEQVRSARQGSGNSYCPK